MTNVELVDTVLASIERGEHSLSQEAIDHEGMTSLKVKSLLNGIVKEEGTRYLEVGVWKGATFHAALDGNKPEVAVAIDNFSQFEGSEAIFLENLKSEAGKFQFVNSDSFSVDLTCIPSPFNVYFYDGDHTDEAQEKALTYFLPALSDEFIYICDDWNFKPAKDGTRRGIALSNLEVVKCWELPADRNGDTVNWWNGVCVVVLRKSCNERND